MALPDFALAVGIGRYPGLSKLDGPEADATAFHQWVTTKGGVGANRAKLIVSSHFQAAPVIADELPNDNEIFAFFRLIRDAAAANNAVNQGPGAGRRLYMFFSGHGFSRTLDTSAVFMANAEQDTPHNISAKAWAERFYENGLFEEVLLFQDACSEQWGDVEIMPPYLRKSQVNGWDTRKRFYAFAAKFPLKAVEKPDGKGGFRGVFSATLMAGLQGGAADPQTGEITSAQLKLYLQENMKARLDAADLANEEVSKRPEIFDLDPFVVVPGSQAPAAAAVFPVEVTFPAATTGQILDHARQPVQTLPAPQLVWNTALPVGLFQLVAPGQPERLFKVSGALGADGTPEVVHV